MRILQSLGEQSEAGRSWAPDAPTASSRGKTFQLLAMAHPELANVESVVLVERRADGGEDYLVRSAAIREVIKGLPKFRLFEIVLRIFPDFISDIGYRIFSKLRTPLFGKWHHCRVPARAGPGIVRRVARVPPSLTPFSLRSTFSRRVSMTYPYTIALCCNGSLLPGLHATLASLTRNLSQRGEGLAPSFYSRY